MIDADKKMAEKLENKLDGDKNEILPVNKGRRRLERKLYFLGTTPRGYEVEYDVTDQELKRSG